MSSRRMVAGLVVAALGFLFWMMRAAAGDVPAYLWANVARVVACLVAAVGVAAMARGRGPAAFRFGLFGLMAVSAAMLLRTVAGPILLPEDIATLFGFLGACAAAYGAANWYGPSGDELAAAWVSGGLLLMAANPGWYVLLGLLAGDLSRDGWMLGSVVAALGLVVAATSVPHLADGRLTWRSGTAAAQ